MPGDVTVSDTNLYQVRPGQPVELRVSIGDAQVGGTAVDWQGSPVPFDEQRKSWRIGTGDVANTIAHAVSIVQDVNPSTNHTSVIYELSGGVRTELFPYEVQVKEDKGRANYVITFVFVA